MNRIWGMARLCWGRSTWLQAVLALGLWLCLTGRGHAQSLFPQELTRFRSDTRNPVFQPAGDGTWEVKIRERGFILREGDLWRLWYTGYDGTRGHPVHLGYATSRDGIEWKRHPGNPLLSDLWIEDVCVVHDGDQWFLFAEGRDDVPHWFTSADGVTWSREGDMDVRLRDGSPVPRGPLGTPTVLRTKAGWNLLYERQDAGIWLARSPDLKVWTNVSDEPVLARGPEPYDTQMIALNQVIKYGDRYYAIYHATKTPEKPRLWTTNLAVSDDLITWEKYSGNPLFPESENKSSGIWVHDGKQFRLYTTHEKIDVHFPVVTPEAEAPTP